MSDGDDPHDLQRFVSAQDEIYADALRELRSAHKQGHWMWFVFPQLDGLGRSETAKFFALKSQAEAVAYLQHEILGPRLAECAAALLAVEGRTAREILGSPDDFKLHSSMTLFAAVVGEDCVFHEVLAKFFDGAPDARTLELLAASR
ncbi:MAG: DUF1810 domain-containing protein [Chthoniobacterales bacterium]|jgi:uncharacterized protein (DUF1810 family)